MSQSENQEQFHTNHHVDGGGWIATTAIVAALILYIWLVSLIVELLAPVAGGQ